MSIKVFNGLINLGGILTETYYRKTRATNEAKTELGLDLAKEYNASIGIASINEEDLKVFESAVRRLVTVPLNQNQFDALVSFVFNVGEGAFKDSTLLRLLNSGNYKAASAQFGKWVYAGKQVLPGLVARRESEYQLFVKP
jgi:GH24 family phage-related lysozyme (muramidase)